MKRIASVILLILVLVNIFSITAFASSGEDSSDSGYSMTLNGVEQQLTYSMSTTTTETAPSGYYYYELGGVNYCLPEFTEYMYYYITYHSGLKAFTLYAWKYDYVPYVVDGSLFTSKRSNVYPYNLVDGVWTRTSSTYYTNDSVGRSLQLDQPLWFSWDVFDNSGSLVYSAGVRQSSASVTTTTDHSFSFSSSDLSGLSAVERELILSGSAVEGDFSGDLKYSLSVSCPYIDVELPVSAWGDEVPVDEDYWSVSINGDLSFDLGIGLQGVSADGQSRYVLSDLVPSSWQLICNGSLMDDFTCSGSFDSVGLTESGYHVNLSMDTGQFNLASVSTGEFGVKLRTLGFRIYLKSLNSGAATAISGYEFDSVTPYTYLNFISADGSSGLPALTFHENYASGDMFGVADSSGYGSSASGLGFNFGYYSNIVSTSGKCFYGNMGELYLIPNVSGYPYVTARWLGDYAYLIYSSTLPYWDGTQIVQSDDSLLYYLTSDSSTWVKAASNYLSFTDYSYVQYINYDLKDSSGSLLIAAMTPSSSGPGPAYSTVSLGSDFLNFNSNAGHAVLYSPPVTYDSVGSVGSKFSFSNEYMTGYVDVTYPAEVFGIRSNGQLLSLLLSGNLAVRASVFPLVADSSTYEYYVPYSFDNPTIVEVIINGEHSDLYLLNYLHEDSTIASVSGFNMSLYEVGNVKTVTFRFHYSVDPQVTEWFTSEDIPVDCDSFAVGVDCEIITSPVFTAEYEPDRVMTGLGKFFDNLAIPYEISQVFDVFVGIWEVIPAAVRFTLIMCFSVACFFAVAKMLF